MFDGHACLAGPDIVSFTTRTAPSDGRRALGAGQPVACNSDNAACEPSNGSPKGGTALFNASSALPIVHIVAREARVWASSAGNEPCDAGNVVCDVSSAGCDASKAASDVSNVASNVSNAACNVSNAPRDDDTVSCHGRSVAFNASSGAFEASTGAVDASTGSCPAGNVAPVPGSATSTARNASCDVGNEPSGAGSVALMAHRGSSNTCKAALNASRGSSEPRNAPSVASYETSNEGREVLIAGKCVFETRNEVVDFSNVSLTSRSAVAVVSKASCDVGITPPGATGWALACSAAAAC